MPEKNEKQLECVESVMKLTNFINNSDKTHFSLYCALYSKDNDTFRHY